MRKKLYIKTYGCQMNVSDSEVVAGILAKDGYTPVDRAEEADLVLLNTCSIREKAMRPLDSGTRTAAAANAAPAIQRRHSNTTTATRAPTASAASMVELA